MVWAAPRAALLAVLLGSPLAAAQPTPPAPSGPAPASTASTQLAKEGLQAVADAAAKSKDSATFKVTAGGFLSTGNSRSIAANAAADYFLRRGRSSFSTLAAANYGRSAPAEGPSETTVENYQASARYDYLLSNRVAGSGAISARRDRFQGLDLRLNIDPGLAYYFLDEKDLRFWGEVGYDFQFDVRRQEVVDASLLDPLAEDQERKQIRHSGRLFAGYLNQLLPAVNFNAGVEYLQDVIDTENARLNVDMGLTSQLDSSFSIATTFAVKFDNNPLPGVKSTDVLSSLNLVYTLDYEP